MTLLDIRLADIRFLFGFVLLVTGLLFPEEKILISGVPFTWVIIGACLLLLFGRIITTEEKNILFKYFIVLGLILILSFLANVPNWDLFFLRYLPVIITVPVAFLLLNCINEHKLIVSLFYFCSVLSVIFVAYRLVQLDFSREGFFIGFGPIVFSRLMAVGILASMFFKKNLAEKVLLGCLILSILIGQSRGPMLFLVIAVLYFLFEKGLSARQLILILLLSPLLLLNERFLSFVSVDLSSFTSISAEELTNSFIEDDGDIDGTLTRLIIYYQSFTLIADNLLFGVGIGNWGKETGLEVYEYPHNILLEVFSEFGILGFILLIIFIFRLINTTPSFCKYVALFYLMNSMVSGSIRDFRYVIVFALIAFFINSYFKKEWKS